MHYITRAEAAELRTRSEYKRNIPLPRMRTELGKRSPLYRGFKIWNGLSKTIQDAPSKFTFKKITIRDVPRPDALKCLMSMALKVVRSYSMPQLWYEV